MTHRTTAATWWFWGKPAEQGHHPEGQKVEQQKEPLWWQCWVPVIMNPTELLPILKQAHPTMNSQCTCKCSFSYHWRSLRSGVFLLSEDPDKTLGWKKASNRPQTYLMLITEKPQWRGREFFPLAFRTQRLQWCPMNVADEIPSAVSGRPLSRGIWADAPRVMEQNGGLSGKWLFSLEKLL